MKDKNPIERKIDRHGRIMIPAVLRDALGWELEADIEIQLQAGGLFLRKKSNKGMSTLAKCPSCGVEFTPTTKGQACCGQKACYSTIARRRRQRERLAKVMPRLYAKYGDNLPMIAEALCGMWLGDARMVDVKAELAKCKGGSDGLSSVSTE